MAGGGAGSDAWCQIYADVLDREVLQLEDPVQANARGAAFIAAVGLRRLKFTEVPERVPVRRAYLPTPAHRRLYDDRFGAFKEAHARLGPLYRRLNAEPRSPTSPSIPPGTP
jgi:xylulokinase